jgi:hypothetical protein
LLPARTPDNPRRPQRPQDGSSTIGERSPDVAPQGNLSMRSHNAGRYGIKAQLLLLPAVVANNVSTTIVYRPTMTRCDPAPTISLDRVEAAEE